MRMPMLSPQALPAKPPALPLPGDLWTATDPWILHGKRVMWGLLAVMLVFGLVSINGAVVATGTVTVENSIKTIQHLDGGIVAKILVRNGDAVKEGDVLLRLDDTQVRASLGVAKGRLSDAMIQQARLEAERDERTDLVLPGGVGAELADPQVVRMLEAQRTLFAARRISRRGEQGVLRQRVDQLQNEIGGLQRQLQSRTKELALNERELAGVLPLFEKGFVNQQRLGPLQRDQARLEGDVGRVRSDVAKARSALAEAEMKLAQSDKEFQSQVAEELRKVQAQIAEFTENRAALEDKLARTEVRSPKTGRVHALAPTTEGGVITPASAIAQLVPAGEKMIVEVRIQPQDVDKVRGGLPAAVKFPTFNAKRTPRLEGIVTTVSPAQIADQTQPGRTFFTAQVELPAEEIAKLGREHALVPGMPAEVYIETAARSMLSYIVKPLVDSMSLLARD